MKKIIIVFLLLNVTVSWGQNSMQVTSNEAKMVAINVLRRTCPKYINTMPLVDTVIPYVENNRIHLFEVSFISGESVIVAGCRISGPVLAVDYDSIGESVFLHPELFSPGFLCILQRMIEEQRACFQMVTRGEDPRWEDWLDSTGNNRESSGDRIIGPLLKTRWSQTSGFNCSSCDNSYNKYMPDSDGRCECSNSTSLNYPTGCTVTAFGQVMNYWQYPVLRNNRVEQIDWCNMPNCITCGETNDKEVEAVARLMKILGDECDVSFGTLSLILDFFINDFCFGYLDPEDALEVLQDDFGYNRHAEVRSRMWNASNWARSVREELNNGRPVVYFSVEDAPWNGAHTFVCDGYDDVTGLFHFNWGHKSHAPKWCSIDNIVEGTNMHWTRMENAVFGFEPRGSQSICNYSVSLDEFYHNNTRLLNNHHPYEITPHTMTTLTSASATSDASWRTIPTGATAVYQAHEEIILQDGFEAQLGCEFEARIEPCEQCEDMREGGISANDDDVVADDNLNNDDGDSEMLHSPNTSPKTLGTDLFPNPTDGPLTMYTDGEPQQVLIYTLDGRPVGGWRLTALGDDFVTLDVSTLRPGTYLLRIQTPAGPTTKKLLVQ